MNDVKILADLIAIPSVNDHELQVASYLKELFHAHDITATILPLNDTRGNLVAEIGSGHPILAVSGHMDVVSAGDLSKWHSDPFTLTEREGKLYGRGSADMKSGLAALALAMIRMKEAGLPQQGTIRLLATTGEEVGGAGAHDLYQKGYMDDVDALLIAEPSQSAIIYAHKGSIDVRITSEGKAAHSSMPQLGYNAIDPLIQLVHDANQLFREDPRENAQLGQLVFNTTIFNGGNQVNSIPEAATLEMNIRTIPEFDNPEVIAKLQQLVDSSNQQGAQLEMDVYQDLPSVFTTGKNNLAQLTQQLGEKYFQHEVQLLASPGVTDAANLLRDKDADFPFVMYGPGITKMAHQVDEYVEKSVYLDFIKLYQELMTAYLS